MYVRLLYLTIAVTSVLATLPNSDYFPELDLVVNVIKGVQNKLAFDCVLFLTSGFQEYREVVQLMRNMSSLDFKSAAFNSVTQELLGKHHVCNTPLNVLLHGAQIRGKFLQPALNFIDSRSRWLLFLKDKDSIEDAFLQVNVPFNLEVVVATPENSGLLLTEVYRVAPDFPLQQKVYGWWNVKTGLRPYSSRGLYSRRRDLQGLHFVAAVIQNPPINVLEVVNDTIYLKSFFGEVWRMLEESLNITTTYQQPKEGKWGNPSASGWDGMVGMLLRGEANVSACGITMLKDRAEVVDFSVPLYTSLFRIFIKKKVEREMVEAEDYLSPFSRGLWAALLTTTLVAAALMVLQYKVTHHFYTGAEERLHLSDAVLFVFGVIFCQQAPASRAQQLSLRMMQMSVNLAGLIAISSYSGTLISSIAVYTPRMPFQDLKELNRTSYSLGMTKNSVAFHSFKVSKEPLMIDLYKKHLETEKNLVKAVNAAFDRVCEEKFVFIAATEALDIDSTRCEVTYLPAYFMTGSMGLAFPRGSPYKGLFDYILIKMIENGVIFHLHDITWRSRTSSVPSTIKSITYTDIRPLLGLLLLGMFVALWLLFCEICCPPGRCARAATSRPRKRRHVNIISHRRIGVPLDRMIVFD